MIATSYNPDVLSCLANLSNDEVFTPPNVVNDMLDLLPAELWSNPKATFLDPVSKTGVFLREIAKRLMEGLADHIPDEQERANHIFKNQIYGIAITELTSLLSRRSVYCSKKADHEKYSLCSDFDDEQGNIRYERLDHTWDNGKCIYCSGSQEVYGREDELETYAYNFIHLENPLSLFNTIENTMKFDVIVGNPPYQLSDGGGRDSGAISLYHKFVKQAIKLNPRFLTMIIPARWYSGGKGLDEYRDEMLNDQRLREIHDFPETSDCFPGLNIRGGICYFLWDREHDGLAKIYNYKNGELLSNAERPLLEKDSHIFIRHNEAISILKKVQSFGEKTFDEMVSARKPFGLDSNFSGYKKSLAGMHNILLYRFGDNGYVSEEQVIKNHQWIKEWKVIVSKASPGGDTYPHQIISRPIVAGPNSCCTETYLVVGVFRNKKVAENVVSYMQTSFFRFMMSLIKNTQNISRGVFAFVPIVDFTVEWSDENLYTKYGITEEEIAFIDTMIRPMNISSTA